MSPRVALVGDFDPENPTHAFTNAALERVGLAFEWIATDDVGADAGARLAACDGVGEPVPQLPQARPPPEPPHPLLAGYAAAVRSAAASRAR